MMRRVNNTAFDVAAAPMFIVALGVPVLLIVAAVLICFFAVKKITAISREKKAAEKK